MRRVETGRSAKRTAWILCLLSLAGAAPAQEKTEVDLTGQWTGALEAGPSKLRIRLQVTKAKDGTLNAGLISVDQSPDPIRADKVSLEGRLVVVTWKLIKASYEGTIAEDGKSIDGTWKQAGRQADLDFTLEKRKVDAAVKRGKPAPKAVVEWMKASAVPLKSAAPGQGFEDMAPLRAVVGKATVVALGEATHGTREFFQLKHRFFEYLVTHMGFTDFVLEASWPEARAVDDYILHGRGDAKAALAGMNFWIWNTEEFLELIEWMRRWNVDEKHERKLRFHGMDMQFPRLAANAVLSYLATVDADLAKEASAPLRPLQSRAAAQSYRRLEEAERRTCRELIARVEARFDEKREAWVKATGTERWEIARQSARVLRQGNAMMGDLRNSFEIRDRAMAENIAWIRERRGPKTKIVIAAHNGHVATGVRPPWTRLGQHLRKSLGDQLLVFGFAFHRGGFRARMAGGGPPRAFAAPPAVAESLDAALAATGHPIFALDLRRVPEGPVRAWLREKRRSRSIDATYSVELDAVVQQPIAVLTDFDALLFVAKTTPSRGL